MLRSLTAIFLLLLCRVGSTPGYYNFWIVWNVGQGQWITQVTSSECRHFDFGGEIQYFKDIQKRFLDLCGRKNNKLYLSHADLDHYSFIGLIAHRSRSLCWMVRPENLQLQSLKIPPCISKRSDSPVVKNQTIVVRCLYEDKNSCSTIFKRERFLIPGDSPKSQEKHWSLLLNHKTQVKILILGHHGSRTSTKNSLLQMLPHLKMAVASARQKKYGHPHTQTQKTLSDRRISLLRTESWGNLVFL